MTTNKKFLIVDGYTPEARDGLENAGMSLAWKLYGDLLQRNLSSSRYEVLLPSDPGAVMPTNEELEEYAGVLWTGCSLTVYDTELKIVRDQIDLCQRAFELGIPQYGSCWALQIAVVAAGGEVKPHPQGREIGLTRKIRLTAEGRKHPFYLGKPDVFDAFISHDDEVILLPEGSTLLAYNDYCIQAAEVKFKKGTFWAIQYHPEYELHEMACLIIAREQKLLDLGFFKTPQELLAVVDDMKALSNDKSRKDLRWKLAIDEDVLDSNIREQEFSNWVKFQVLKQPIP